MHADHSRRLVVRAVPSPTHLSVLPQCPHSHPPPLTPFLHLHLAQSQQTHDNDSNINAYHRRLAEIIEMIHTASLVHDDVLDNCNVRRGKDTVNSLYGTRVAVLVGDFLFAQSSWYLANLDNLEVIKLISQVRARSAAAAGARAAGGAAAARRARG